MVPVKFREKPVRGKRCATKGIKSKEHVYYQFNDRIDVAFKVFPVTKPHQWIKVSNVLFR